MRFVTEGFGVVNSMVLSVLFGGLLILVTGIIFKNDAAKITAANKAAVCFSLFYPLLFHKII